MVVKSSTNALFEMWLSDKGALWKPTPRDSPQQNVSERLNRTMWDRIRPMMLASALYVTCLRYAV